MVVAVAAALFLPKKKMVPDLPFLHFLPFIHFFIFTMCFFLGACCATHAAHAGRILHARCTEIEQNLQLRSRVFSRKFARFRTPQSCNLDAERSSDSAESCADVVHVAQRMRRTPAEVRMRVAPKSNKICSTSAHFLAKICTISNAAIVQSRCRTKQ